MLIGSQLFQKSNKLNIFVKQIRHPQNINVPLMVNVSSYSVHVNFLQGNFHVEESIALNVDISGVKRVL